VLPSILGRSLSVKTLLNSSQMTCCDELKSVLRD